VINSMICDAVNVAVVVVVAVAEADKDWASAWLSDELKYSISAWLSMSETRHDKIDWYFFNPLWIGKQTKISRDHEKRYRRVQNSHDKQTSIADEQFVHVIPLIDTTNLRRGALGTLAVDMLMKNVCGFRCQCQNNQVL
jgi:hypothetical protein